MPLAAQIALHGLPSLRLQSLQCRGKQRSLFVQGTGAIGHEPSYTVKQIHVHERLQGELLQPIGPTLSIYPSPPIQVEVRLCPTPGRVSVGILMASLRAFRRDSKQAYRRGVLRKMM